MATLWDKAATLIGFYIISKQRNALVSNLANLVCQIRCVYEKERMLILKKQFLVSLLALSLCFGAISIVAYVPTGDEVVEDPDNNYNDDGYVEAFSFREKFDTTVEPIAANNVDVPIYEKGITVQLKWVGVKNAKKYKFTVKNLKTNKTIYSLSTDKKNASFPGSKNKSNGSYLVTVHALNSKGKTIRTCKTIFHTGKAIVDSKIKINNGLLLYVIDDLQNDLVGVAYNGMFGSIQDDGTLYLSGEKLQDM